MEENLTVGNCNTEKKLWLKYLICAIIGAMLMYFAIDLLKIKKSNYVISHNWETIICLDGIRQISVWQYTETKQYSLSIQYSNEGAGVKSRELKTEDKEKIGLIANKISRALNGKPMFVKLPKSKEATI